MKTIMSCMLLLSVIYGQSQYNYDSEGLVRVGAGYTHDFPGLNGYTVRAEFIRSIYNQLEAGVALQRVQVNGYPRVSSVQEYTKATTMDLQLYFLPLQTEIHTLRLGVGYSFSFYNIRRAYPVSHGEGEDKEYTWPTIDGKGRKSGLNVSAEYEYTLPESPLSFGVRASLFKAYDQVSYFGPFVGVRL